MVVGLDSQAQSCIYINHDHCYVINPHPIPRHVSNPNNNPLSPDSFIKHVTTGIHFLEFLLGIPFHCSDCFAPNGWGKVKPLINHAVQVNLPQWPHDLHGRVMFCLLITIISPRSWHRSLRIFLVLHHNIWRTLSGHSHLFLSHLSLKPFPGSWQHVKGSPHKTTWKAFRDTENTLFNLII